LGKKYVEKRKREKYESKRKKEERKWEHLG
jgi:hypothetical protein